MRWLLRKDLQILRRSPLLVSVLVIYPIAVALLAGLALSSPPGKPKVAFANLVPPDASSFAVGDQRLDASTYSRELFRVVDPIRVRTREAAIAKVRDGSALGALVIPEDAIERLRGAVNLSGSAARPTIEVYYNAEDPLKRRYVESLISSRVADANRALTGELTKLAARYLRILLNGGDFSLLGRTFNVLGLQNAKTVVDGTIASLPPSAPQRLALAQVSRFAKLAIENLDLSDQVLASVGNPVEVRQTIVRGKKTRLNAYAVAVSVTLSVMLVALLLGAGMLALEREEHAYGRLVRGLVSRSGLLAEKVVLAAGCALVPATAMLAGLVAFVGGDWARAPLWLLALAGSALAFAALGVALGALAREVRAATLLGVLLVLPLAVIGLVPAGTVSGGLESAIGILSALFPFRPALDALEAALGGSSGGASALLLPLGHLGLLAAGYGAIARLGLRRFAT